jgi:hypothetical protein
MSEENSTKVECTVLSQYDYKCSFSSDPKLISNSLLFFMFFMSATIMLVINVFVLVFSIKKEKTRLLQFTSYTSFCFFFIFFYNILGSMLSYLGAIDLCYNLNGNYYFCVIKSCLVYFIGIMMTKVYLMIALERLIAVRWIHKYKKYARPIYLFLINIFVTIVGFLLTFSPLIFDWNSYKDSCDCGLNNILPKPYVLVLNTLFFFNAIPTISIYLYIYFYVKKTRRKIFCINGVGDDRKSISHVSDLPNYVNGNSHSSASSNQHHHNHHAPIKTNSSASKSDKIQILKSQTLLFFIFFGSWLPFILITMYEALANVTYYGIVARIRNLFLSFIMISCVLNPIVYMRRVKAMKAQ